MERPVPDLSHINDWEIIQETGLGPWGFGFRHICRDMREIGQLLYKRGYMPEVKDNPESTHGNMAARINSLTDEFIITAADSHMGRLKPSDFVWVREINESGGSITVRVDNLDKKLSTDVWLAGGIFKRFPTVFSVLDNYTVQGGLKEESKKRPQIGAVIYAHRFSDTRAQASVPRSALGRYERTRILERLEKGAKIVALVNHRTLAIGATLRKAFEQFR